MTMHSARTVTHHGTRLTLTPTHTVTARRWELTDGRTTLGTVARTRHTPPGARSPRTGWTPTTPTGTTPGPLPTRGDAIAWLTGRHP